MTILKSVTVAALALPHSIFNERLTRMMGLSIPAKVHVVNITRAKDAAIALALAHLNQAVRHF